MHRHQRRDSAELFVSTSHDPLLRLPLSRSQYMLSRSRYMLCRSQYILCRPQYILCRSSTFVTHTQCHRHPIKIENSHTRAVGTNKSQHSHSDARGVGGQVVAYQRKPIPRMQQLCISLLSGLVS